MKTCSECSHWEHAFDEPELERIGFGLCQKIIAHWKIEEAEAKKHPGLPGAALYHLELQALKDAKAHVCDGSSYMAELRTQGDFGCTLFDPKESP
jgi:hypothetical protein